VGAVREILEQSLVSLCWKERPLHLVDRVDRASKRRAAEHRAGGTAPSASSVHNKTEPHGYATNESERRCTATESLVETFAKTC
jgi:hypothetical protein